jgi:hypothetical protein
MSDKVGERWRDYFVDLKSTNDYPIWEWNIRSAFRQLRHDSGTWPDFVALLEEAYAVRGLAEGHSLLGWERPVNALPGYARRMPLPLARSIMGSAERYPIELLGLAEARLRASIATGIDSVGEIALKDGWQGSQYA